MAETELAGTRIPRWTVAGAAPEPGFAELAAALPPELVTALQGLAPLPLPAVLLAAHLKVLSELSAERHVLTNYRPPGGGPAQRCAATVADGSWRQLTEAAERASASGEPAAATVETLLDLSCAGDAPEAECPENRLALRVRYAAGTLRLRYRRDVATADFAGRLAGYYRTALALLAADPDAAHHLQSLVSGAELHTHLHELSGRRVPEPDRLFVALFEDQVRARPHAIAAVHNGHRWSYRELNEHANRLAHLLLRNGLAAEDVVAVCLERNLDWLAAMLGVFKAGGVYLPVRPDFPPERVATQLERSGCRLGLTQPGSAGTLLAAAVRSGGCTVLDVEDGYRQRDGEADADPAVPLAPGQLAYIYFTSGSTGTPKGAMCEHGGLLNHLYAKVDDLGLGPGDVVTQTASQCFDISLWQLAAPLLVGACTEIIDTELQLDVGRFVGRLAAGGIHVIQIVPAYLDVLLGELERHRVPLGDLRSVSVTGEALRAGLVHRWFALYPEISLVNAYGATELSDDTMHAVLRGRPERDLPIVVVGRSLRNINTYVLNDRLRVAPLGAPGEIAFSGICVGRGYINDPERTAQAFTDDPYRPGTRLYRTGDFGRWLPEGTIEFLGRRDEQVKIRGFRIEIGEIEHRLLQAPGVREAAVVIHGRSDQTRNLVAFVTGSDQLVPAALRAFLAAALPDYMVPAHLHRLDALPLNENGKVNKRSLIELAGELGGELAAGLAGEPGQQAAAHEPPATPTERRLATAWAEILAVPPGRIGRRDDFFRLGGTSLAAVRLMIKLDRQVSLRQLVAHPVLSDLAAAIDGAAETLAAEAPAAGVAAGGVAAGVLQLLSTLDGGPVSASLVCFPYAGGNAVNFTALAKELEPAGIAVYGVEPPGHDLARPDEPLSGVAELAARVHAELSRVTEPILLWGHCAGAAPALELTRLMEKDGPAPARLFLGALLLDTPTALRSEIDAVAALSNQQITALLREHSAYVELDHLETERTDLVGPAFRHDVQTSNDYLIAAQDSPTWQPLRTPLEVVIATDDPTTTGHPTRYRNWTSIADTVQLHELDEGGHYFVRTRPAALADLLS